MNTNHSRPNIVFILADDMGYGDFSAFSEGLSSTPALDALMQESICFTQHYSASPMCAPARASLLTGRYPHRTGAIEVRELRGLCNLALRETTVADLRKSGVLMAAETSSKASGSALVGKTLVVTGTLGKYTRDEIHELIRQNGGRASSSISRKTVPNAIYMPEHSFLNIISLVDKKKNNKNPPMRRNRSLKKPIFLLSCGDIFS